MNAIGSTRMPVRNALIAIGVFGMTLVTWTGPWTALAKAGAHPSVTRTAQRDAEHSAQTLPAALRPVFYQALAKDAGATYAVNKAGCASLPRQKLKACFDADGAHFKSATPLALRLTAWGRGNDLAAVTPVHPAIKDNEVSYRHGVLREWWRVLPTGFEQGFTIAKRPAGHGDLMLTLALSRRPGVGRDPVKKRIPTAGRDIHSYRIPASAVMTKKSDNTLAWGKLHYGKLVVTDANGKVVPATLKINGDRILIAVNDAHAAYPLTVDPLVWLEQNVTASDGAADDLFAYSVAVDRTTALVGAEFADVNGNQDQGAVYVFSESGGTWTQTQKLTASDGAASDDFGVSVALDGTTALVGVNGGDVNGRPGCGLRVQRVRRHVDTNGQAHGERRNYERPVRLLGCSRRLDCSRRSAIG